MAIFDKARGLFAVVIACAMWGCVTTVETPETSFNPAPTSSFSSCTQIELNPVQYDPGLPSGSANQAALDKIQESGDTIAYPEFYQRAAAMGGAYTVGVTDNLMLVRIANLLVEYLKSNYETAVGGPTGV